MVAGSSQAEYAWGGEASANLLTVLGIRTERGRWFGADDGQRGGPRVVVLSHALWQRQFGGDTGVIARPLRIYEEPWTVIGVLPAAVGLPLNAQFWLPGGDRGQVVARPRAGVSMAEIDSELTRLSPSVERMRKFDPGLHLIVTSLHDQLYGSARLLQVLAAFAAATPPHIVTAVRDDVRRFAGDAEQSDDLTLICVRRET